MLLERRDLRDQGLDQPLWDLTTYDDLPEHNEFLAEAVVAAYGDDLRRGLVGSSWEHGNSNQAADVTWFGHAVKVKEAFLQDVHDFDGQDSRLGFLDSDRTVEACESVTHYALVYFNGGSQVEVDVTGEVTVKSARPTVFLIPTAEIFCRRCSVAGVEYLSIEEVDQWRVLGPRLPTNSIARGAQPAMTLADAGSTTCCE